MPKQGLKVRIKVKENGKLLRVYFDIDSYFLRYLLAVLVMLVLLLLVEEPVFVLQLSNSWPPRWCSDGALV